MIEIDGIKYKASWEEKGYELTADIINGDESGRLQGNKDMYLDYIGTFFNSTAKIIRDKNCTDAEWDNLFLKLSNPVNKHTVKIPFLQGHLKTEIYISQVKTTLIAQKFQKNKWDDKFNITFTAISSEWLAGREITNYIAGVNNG